MDPKGKKKALAPKLSPPRIFREKPVIDLKDPVKASDLDDQVLSALEKIAKDNVGPKKKIDFQIEPDISKRLQLGVPPGPVMPAPSYVVPKSPKEMKERAERRVRAERDRNFCKWEALEMPRPFESETIGVVVKSPSPNVSKTKLKAMPREPSGSGLDAMPELPEVAELKIRKPKSGIYINRQKKPEDFYEKDSFDLVYERKPRPKRPGDVDEDDVQTKKKDMMPIDERAEPVIQDDSPVEAVAKKDYIDEEEPVTDTVLTKLYRRKVSQCSVATSVNTKELEEFPTFDEEDFQEQPYMTKIVQKFRRDSEAERYKPPPRKILRGTLESHSFTKLEQPVLRDFYYGVVLGTVNQCDSHFSASVRGMQGICMPVAAYCYSMLLHPNKWTELVIDDILEIGTKLYTESVSMLHMHNVHVELQFYQLAKYCVVETKKLNFQVYEPEIVGQVRSTDKKIYNIHKGLQVFFNRQRAGIIKSHGLNVVVWKDKHYYFFDARGRTKDLYSDTLGPAMLAHVYDIPALSTILLKHTDLGNRPFTISKISVTKILEKDEPEEDGSYDVMPERSHYNIIDETKAVVLGSFDLADLCFDFSRNKQAIAMATVCLVYSRITPPSSWHRKTIDKIMIIGNQLYLELVESENVVEMTLQYVPAIFTLGPYVVEILIYSNIYADVMVKKGICVLQKCLEKFFSTNTMAIVFIDKATLAIWTQRNMFYCFDPYSRNGEAFKCRNGNACVSMNSTIESVARTIATNFSNPNDIFYIHALKVIKIHRDPAQEQFFPKTATMDDASPESFKECRVKKSKRKAVQKTVTADFAEGAVKELTPWDYLEQSFIEVGSTVGSLTQIPKVHKFPSKIVLRGEKVVPRRKTIDLDSPSLSDTQIEPERPEPMKNEAELDMTSWELTMEELELQDDMEEGGLGEEEGAVDEEYEAYMAMNRFAQVHQDSFSDGYQRMSAQVNTDITVGFLPIPREILPSTNITWKQKMLKEKEIERRRQMLIMQSSVGTPVITQSMELAKNSNFVDLPDNTQIVLGSTDIGAHGGDVEYMAPFICMMASAVAQKYALCSWSKEIVDYTLRSGAKLYALSKVRYDQVPILDVPKVSLGSSKFSILTEYLHDAVLKQRVLEETLLKVLFKKYDCGLIATPSYACTVFFNNYLFYLFDCFGCNQVGLAVTSTQGVACLSRFKNVHDLAKRIIYNKTKRDDAEEYEFSRFVVSACTSKPIPLKPSRYRPRDEEAESGAETEASDHQARGNRVGYQLNGSFLTLQGSKALQERKKIDYDELKRDHFVCICACLLLLNYPILRWDTKRVDYVIDQGNHIYDHAENLSISEKRIMRNILIYQNFFDIIIASIKIPDGNKRNLAKNLEWVTNKRDYVLLQFPNCCYVIYKHNSYFHVFDPYPCAPNGEADLEEKGKAGWTIFNTFGELNDRIKKQVIKDGEHFLFYTFEVTAVSKAPKSLIVGQKMLDYEMDKDHKPEKIGSAPFYERDVWLMKDPVPWSRVKSYSATESPRGRSNVWHSWDIEFPNDLYSLIGSFHQGDERFSDESRGKQTLANIVVAVGMTEIYPLAEWTAAIVDSILICGDNYFLECVKEIKEKNYQFDTDDLQPSCVIFPYTFEVTLIPVIDGTMFVVRSNQFNLYKALRVFFDNFDKRKGMLCCDKGNDEKRFVGLGKMKENEYFMFDCQVNGPPMFVENRGAGYMLRCRTLKRLLYVLTLTLRGGDFFIFEVDVSNLKPIQ